jgi:hypothetical protein
MFRTLALVLGVLALFCLFAAPATAVVEEKGDTHEGTFVKGDAKSFTMKGKDDKEHSHDLAADAKVTCDGKDCKITDLKAGNKLKVTLGADKKATRVEASTK